MVTLPKMMRPNSAAKDAFFCAHLAKVECLSATYPPFKTTTTSTTNNNKNTTRKEIIEKKFNAEKKIKIPFKNYY